MKKCIVVCGYKPNIDDIKINCDLFGVDAGCLYLVKKGINNFIGIGDFDSVSEKDYELIKNSAKEIIKLNPIKDDTDLEHAFNYLIEKGYTNIDLFGALGGRQDHNLLNLKLIYLSKLNVTAYDDKNKIYVLNEGNHIINKDGYDYISLFPFKKTIVTLKGTKYLLDNKEINLNDNYTTSNEILNDKCEINITKGKLLVIQAKD